MHWGHPHGEHLPWGQLYHFSAGLLNDCRREGRSWPPSFQPKTDVCHWCNTRSSNVSQDLTITYNNINVVNLVGKLNNQLIIPKCGWFLGLAPSPNGMIPLPDCHKNHWGWGVSPAEMESTYRVMQLGIAQHCDMKLIWESTVFTHYCWLVIPIISIIHYIPYKSLSTTVTF